jgi:hypothetical protein
LEASSESGVDWPHASVLITVVAGFLERAELTVSGILSKRSFACENSAPFDRGHRAIEPAQQREGKMISPASTEKVNQINM